MSEVQKCMHVSMFLAAQRFSEPWHRRHANIIGVRSMASDSRLWAVLAEAPSSVMCPSAAVNGKGQAGVFVERAIRPKSAIRCSPVPSGPAFGASAGP